MPRAERGNLAEVISHLHHSGELLGKLDTGEKVKLGDPQLRARVVASKSLPVPALLGNGLQKIALYLTEPFARFHAPTCAAPA
jgi:hypothetical protein